MQVFEILYFNAGSYVRAISPFAPRLGDIPVGTCLFAVLRTN